MNGQGYRDKIALKMADCRLLLKHFKRLLTDLLTDFDDLEQKKKSIGYRPISIIATFSERHGQQSHRKTKN